MTPAGYTQPFQAYMLMLDVCLLVPLSMLIAAATLEMARGNRQFIRTLPLPWLAFAGFGTLIAAFPHWSLPTYALMVFMTVNLGAPVGTDIMLLTLGGFSWTLFMISYVGPVRLPPPAA